MPKLIFAILFYFSIYSVYAMPTSHVETSGVTSVAEVFESDCIVDGVVLHHPTFSLCPRLNNSSEEFFVYEKGTSCKSVSGICKGYKNGIEQVSRELSGFDILELNAAMSNGCKFRSAGGQLTCTVGGSKCELHKRMVSSNGGKLLLCAKVKSKCKLFAVEKPKITELIKERDGAIDGRCMTQSEHISMFFQPMCKIVLSDSGLKCVNSSKKKVTHLNESGEIFVTMDAFTSPGGLKWGKGHLFCLMPKKSVGCHWHSFTGFDFIKENVEPMRYSLMEFLNAKSKDCGVNNKMECGNGNGETNCPFGYSLHIRKYWEYYRLYCIRSGNGKCNFYDQDLTEKNNNGGMMCLDKHTAFVNRYSTALQKCAISGGGSGGTRKCIRRNPFFQNCYALEAVVNEANELNYCLGFHDPSQREIVCKMYNSRLQQVPAGKLTVATNENILDITLGSVSRHCEFFTLNGRLFCGKSSYPCQNSQCTAPGVRCVVGPDYECGPYTVKDGKISKAEFPVS